MKPIVVAVCDAPVTPARTGWIGDGKAFMRRVAKVIRIRTEGRGEDAG